MMKKFIVPEKIFIAPEIELRDLSPVKSVMDDITFSGEFTGPGNEHIVPDPGKDDEAVW